VCLPEVQLLPTLLLTRFAANLLGEELYRHLIECLCQYLSELKQRSKSYSDEALLRFYVEEWTYYTRSAKCIDHIFRYLYRHWIRRVMDEGKKNIYDVYTLHLVQWIGELVQEISGDVTEAVLKLVEKHRNGETIENSQTKAVVDSFASLRLDDTDLPKPTLDVYRYHFERPFIEAIKADYQAESAQSLSENLVVACKKALSLLEEEEQRVTLYWHPDIKPQLTKACNNTAATLKLATGDYAVIEVGK
jgi:cullin 1